MTKAALFYTSYTSEDVISNDVCQKIIELAKGHWEPATVTDFERTNNYRISDVTWSNEQWIYDVFWEYMLEANYKSGWRYNLTAAESVQLTRYSKGGHYTWHLDGLGSHNELFNDPDNKFLHNNTRKLSMTLLLNDEFKGGDLQIRTMELEDTDKYTPKLVQGSMIFFPSFIEHQITPITEGTRYSLVCWFLGTPFV
tara:strand:+ start:125 stop:715 length:591 start_codon:yes stop_codon:yes gene_type:complete